METPYDKAQAITEYLRRNITYVETIEGQPQPGQEVIDWFLFDYKEGFCNLFRYGRGHSAASGRRPARSSIGYAEGELITEERRGARPDREAIRPYSVRRRDSHAGPEVFPGIVGSNLSLPMADPISYDQLDDTLNPLIPNLAEMGQRDRELEEARD